MSVTRGYGWTQPENTHRGSRSNLTGWRPADYLLLGPEQPVTNQDWLGGCTGHAVATAMRYCLKLQGIADWLPSPLDLYLGGRILRGSQDVDSGATLANVLTHAEKAGFGRDELWEYATHIHDFRGPPPKRFELDRDLHRLVNWEPLDWHLGTILWELASAHPVTVGLRVYQEFEHVGADGVVPMPAGGQVGGHAVTIVGYSLNRGAFRIQNSWGPEWGQKGFGWISFQYVLNPYWCGEIHAVRVVRAIEAARPEEPVGSGRTG